MFKIREFYLLEKGVEKITSFTWVKSLAFKVKMSSQDYWTNARKRIASVKNVVVVGPVRTNECSLVWLWKSIGYV